ncbi:hypothetical protein J7T55_015511 [Diaporthe amygdali]|uniref:uncharacterized protein n=1 Tax=Phomopsis amygdali TaxID=1214568 RepID=UPI0022FDB544|nr:uncharacterized protein J7T55_015511 [Diaporthe amygdali]KAJ0120778.1 hypothetical protein J7T55_015511 [Diaporthe amygdali]
MTGAGLRRGLLGELYTEPNWPSGNAAELGKSRKAGKKKGRCIQLVFELSNAHGPVVEGSASWWPAGRPTEMFRTWHDAYWIGDTKHVGTVGQAKPQNNPAWLIGADSVLAETFSAPGGLEDGLLSGSHYGTGWSVVTTGWAVVRG